MTDSLPSQIEVLQLADGLHFRLPPPAGSYPDGLYEVCVTNDGKLRWQIGSGYSPSVQEIAVKDLAQFEVGPFGDLALLAVETQQGGPRAVCTGYPKAWLEALADVLRGHCGIPTRTGSELRPTAPARPETIASPADWRAATFLQLGEGLRSCYENIQAKNKAASARVAEFKENPDRPPYSRVIHEVRDNGVSLIVPPGGPGPFFLMGCALCAIAVLPTLAGLTTGFQDNEGSYGPLAITAVFWAVALAVFLPAYHHAYAQVALAVAGDELETLESSKVRTRRRSWSRADLTDIRSGDNGWASGGDESNLTPVAELHILPRAEKKIGLLAGRDAAEVCWIATVLRHALRLPHPR